MGPGAAPLPWGCPPLESSTSTHDISNSSEGLKPTGTPVGDGDVQGWAAAPLQMWGRQRPPARCWPQSARARPEDSPPPHVPESPWHAPHAREAPRPPGAASCPTPAVPVSPRGAIASPSKPEGQLGRGPAGLSAMRGDRLPARLLPRTPNPARHPHPSQRRPRALWGDTRRGRPVSPAQTSQRGPCRVRGTGRVSKRVGTAAGTRAAQLGRRVFAGRRGRAGARGGARAGLVRAAEALCDRAGRLQGGKTKNKKQSIV